MDFGNICCTILSHHKVIHIRLFIRLFVLFQFCLVLVCIYLKISNFENELHFNVRRIRMVNPIGFELRRVDGYLIHSLHRVNRESAENTSKWMLNTLELLEKLMQIE